MQFSQLDVEISNTLTFVNLTDFLVMASNSNTHSTITLTGFYMDFCIFRLP